jgi:hypothetical protein
MSKKEKEIQIIQKEEIKILKAYKLFNLEIVLLSLFVLVAPIEISQLKETRRR